MRSRVLRVVLWRPERIASGVGRCKAEGGGRSSDYRDVGDGTEVKRGDITPMYFLYVPYCIVFVSGGGGGTNYMRR